MVEVAKFVYTCDQCGKFTSDALLVYDAGDMALIQTYLTSDLTVEAMAHIDMTNGTWTPITVTGAADPAGSILPFLNEINWSDCL